MASFFEKLIGGQTEELPVKEKKPAVKTVKKTIKPRLVQEPEPMEGEEEEKPEGKEGGVQEEAMVEEEPETVEEPVRVAPRVEKKTRAAEKEGSPELEGQLAIDVCQTNKEIIIQSTIAGVKPDNLEVTIENGMVTIRGSRNQTESADGKNYLIQECHWGSFSRQFVLPSEVDPSRSEALLKEGILTIKIPKIQKEKVTKLLVKE